MSEKVALKLRNKLFRIYVLWATCFVVIFCGITALWVFLDAVKINN